MKNKKGAIAIEKVIAIVLGLIVLAVLGYFFWKTTASAGEVTASQILMAQSDACLLKAEKAYNSGMIFEDTDNDGYPDSCDVCFGMGDEDGYNQEDADLDGMPDSCDMEPYNPKKNGCAEYVMWDSEEEKQFNNICCTANAGTAEPKEGIDTKIYCRAT